jgi:hypothetical protein
MFDSLSLAILASLWISSQAVQAFAIPEPTAIPSAQANFAVPAPLITPVPRSYNRRNPNIIDDIKSGADNVLHSLGSVLKTDLPSYVASGIPNYFQDFPVGNDVKSKLGINDRDLDAVPTQVLNVPPYANWTDAGWNVRFRGNVFKTPNISQEKIDDLANVFLIDVDIKDLPPDQQAQARNLTRSIFVVQQEDQNVTMALEPAPSQGSSGEPGGGGAVTPGGGSQNVTLPYLTTDQGDFDVFVPIANTSGGLLAGNETDQIQRLNVYAHGSSEGNATAFLVPPQGITILSDIDDILRVTKIYQPKEGLLNSFARPFTPWMNMPDIYANWSRSLPNSTHFHYLTTTPEQVTRIYMDFIYKTYPGGSFDTRPLNFSDVSATLSIRDYLLRRIFSTFPQRRFVLVADTSNSDVMKAYPQLAHDFPNQVQCILLRNTSATDPTDLFPYDTKGFEGLEQGKYMFFRTPDDLVGLDIQGGDCWNESVVQNVTFGLQDEVLGIHGAADRYRAFGVWGSVAFAGLVAAAVMV